MGTSCSKLCKKKSKKYEKNDEDKNKRNKEDRKHHNNKKRHRHPKQPIEGGSDKRKGRGQPRQPTQNESNVNYAINDRRPTENNKGNDENMKENNYIRPNIGDQMENDENMKENNYVRPNFDAQMKAGGNKGNNYNKKRRGKRNKKHKRNSYSSDSSWSSSSSSTSSSSEDEDKGKTTKSRQKKRNNDGSVTYVTNKTTIGSSKISFKAAGNVNIYHNKNKTYMPNQKSEKFRKLFTKEYTETSAKNEERELFSFLQGQTPSHGQFVDLRGQENVEPAITYGLLYECSKWVGQISFPKGHCTCFRVGTKYIMTALHSIREIVREYDDFIRINGKLQQDESPDISVLSSGDVTVDFNYEVEHQPFRERRTFRFKRIEREEEIPFLDKETDTVVLELQEHLNQEFPLQFTNFGIPKLDKAFHLITHSNGDPKAIDKVNKIVDINDPKTIADINFLKLKSNEFMQKNGKDVDIHKCEIRPYNTIANRSRLLFHCASCKGASGSPGVQTSANGKLVVVTMLLHGYPDWYYDKDCEALKTGWPNEYTIEQGVNFASVYSKMKSHNVALCENIFPAEESRGFITKKLHVVQPTDAK